MRQIYVYKQVKVDRSMSTQPIKSQLCSVSRRQQKKMRLQNNCGMMTKNSGKKQNMENLKRDRIHLKIDFVYEKPVIELKTKLV